ncbi:uncharacterized protein ACBT57_026953 isoform 3-T9 [Dama dama]
MPFAWKLRVLTTRPPGCRTRSRSPSSSPRPPKTTTRPPRRASLRGCATAGTPSRCRRRMEGKYQRPARFRAVAESGRMKDERMKPLPNWRAGSI